MMGRYESTFAAPRSPTPNPTAVSAVAASVSPQKLGKGVDNHVGEGENLFARSVTILRTQHQQAAKNPINPVNPVEQDKKTGGVG